MDPTNICRNMEQLIQKFEGNETNIVIQDLKINKDGFSHDIAMCNLLFSNKNTTFSNHVVFKDFSANGKRKLQHTAYTTEISLLKNGSLNRHVNVPQIYFTDKEKQTVLMEQIIGFTLNQLCIIKPERKTWAFEKFGKTLSHIHSTDLKSIRKHFKEQYVTTEEYYKSYIQNLRNRVIEFNQPKYLYILDSIEEKFQAVTFHESLIHGDYHFLNVIITEKDECFVLDWEKATIADSRYDIANAFVLGYSWFGVDFKEPMLQAYENSMNMKVEDLDCFEALLSFDSFTKTIPLIQGADDSHIRDRSFQWLKRRYEQFVTHNECRIEEAEDYLQSKGISLAEEPVI